MICPYCDGDEDHGCDRCNRTGTLCAVCGEGPWDHDDESCPDVPYEEWFEYRYAQGQRYDAWCQEHFYYEVLPTFKEWLDGSQSNSFS